jgi:osmotically-inducible protein OsmY
MHRGKGPKGYQRTDDRLRELICERLTEDPEIDPGDVSITVASSRVTLEGSVDSRRTKNAIEDIVEQFDVSDVQNNLRVSREAVSSAQGDWGKTAGVGDASKQKRN